MPALFYGTSDTGETLDTDLSLKLSALSPKKTCILFHSTVNGIQSEYRIDDATRSALSLCDGSSTTDQIVKRMKEHFGFTKDDSSERLTQALLTALNQFYKAGIIIFGEYRAGWGWTYGAR